MKKNKIVTVALLILIALSVIVLGIPKTDIDERDILKDEKEEALDRKDKGNDNLEDLRPDGKEQDPEFKELRMQAVAPLSEEEEYQLKITNYNAYIRYKAQLQQPGRLVSSSQEEIVKERIAPKLLGTLKKNKEAQSDK